MRYYEYMIAEGKKDMSNKFKVGDKVRVVDNHCGHGFEVGDVVVLEADCGTDWKASIGEDSWWLVEREFEPYVELDTGSMSEFKFSSGPTVWDKDIGDEGIKEASSMDYNNVSKPAHYNHGNGIECIDYIKQVLGKEGFVAYCRGNQMKYQHRAFYKGNPVEDMEKAHQYQAWAIETLKEIHK